MVREGLVEDIIEILLSCDDIGGEKSFDRRYR